jgi:AcrR family transcriptional regulator
VLEATTELLRFRSQDEISVLEIAEKSGVHPATIYRRWGSIGGVLLDRAAANLEDESPVPDTGSLETDLFAYAQSAAASIEAPDGLEFLRLVLNPPAANLPALDDAGRMVLQHRASGIQKMLDKAASRGESSLHFVDVIDGILAPLYFRRLFEIGSVDDDYLRMLVRRTSLSPSLRVQTGD